MDVASQVKNLEITDEIIKRFGEPPKDGRIKIRKVAGRIMLINFAIMFAIASIDTALKVNILITKDKLMVGGFVFIFTLVVDLLAQRFAGVNYESRLLDYKYMVWKALMQDPSFSAKARTSRDDPLTEEERRRIQEQEDEDYYDSMLEQEAEVYRMIAEEEERIKEEEEEYLRIVSHNID